MTQDMQLVLKALASLYEEDVDPGRDLGAFVWDIAKRAGLSDDRCHDAIDALVRGGMVAHASSSRARLTQAGKAATR